jgi:hypothetical protein
MKASEFKCPTCGGGFVDIDPDFDLSGRDSLLGLATDQITAGKCANGHRFAAHVKGRWHETLAAGQRAIDPKTGQPYR